MAGLCIRFKESDFAMSLTNSQLKDSGIAKHGMPLRFANGGTVFLTDFEAYLPSYGAPAAFMALPIFDGDNRLGSLVVKCVASTNHHVDDNNKQWEKVGLGKKTGEAYLLADKRPVLKAAVS